MTRFIKREDNEEIKYKSVSSISEATFKKSDGILVLTYPGKDGRDYDEFLRGSEAIKAKELLDSLC